MSSPLTVLTEREILNASAASASVTMVSLVNVSILAIHLDISCLEHIIEISNSIVERRIERERFELKKRLRQSATEREKKLIKSELIRRECVTGGKRQRVE